MARNLKLAALDLVTLDLDYTTFLGNSVLFLNKTLGISGRIEELHTDYREGRISERELLMIQWPILEEVKLSEAYEVLARGPILNRLERGVKLLRSNGCDVQMLTFNPFQLFFTRYGINTDVSFVCEVKDDHFGKINTLPENKVDFLKQFCKNKSIDLMRCAHVGDSQNDIATFDEVGYSIALNASDTRVEKAASISLRTRDFMDVANSILHASELV